MFENVFDLSAKRTPLGALGFYITYMLIGLVVGVIIIFAVTILYCMLHTEACQTNGEQIGKQIGTISGLVIVFLYCAILGAVMVSVKRLWTNAAALILYIVTLPLSFIGGAFLGLIPLAVISTMDSKTPAQITVNDESNDETSNQEN